eukprot:1879809-Prymnesium_polylepis.2
MATTIGSATGLFAGLAPKRWLAYASPMLEITCPTTRACAAMGIMYTAELLASRTNASLWATAHCCFSGGDAMPCTPTRQFSTTAAAQLTQRACEACIAHATAMGADAVSTTHLVGTRSSGAVDARASLHANAYTVMCAHTRSMTIAWARSKFACLA